MNGSWKEEYKRWAMASVRRSSGEPAGGWDPRCILPSRPQWTGLSSLSFTGDKTYINSVSTCVRRVFSRCVTAANVRGYGSIWLAFHPHPLVSVADLQHNLVTCKDSMIFIIINLFIKCLCVFIWWAGV